MVRTIGVAIGVPEPWGSRLDARRAAVGDPMAEFIPAHLTLLGPMIIESEPERLTEVERHLDVVARTHRPFDIMLRGTGTFRPVTRVVFVAVAAGSQECVQLADDIRSGPLATELAFPYHPHVTIAHDIDDTALDRAFAELSGFTAQWRVNMFTLYQHGSDGHWRPLRHFVFDNGHSGVKAAQ